MPPRKVEAPPAESANGGGAGAKRPVRQPPWEKDSSPADTGSFGEWLRRQREMREISLRDIADRTKISLRYLEAMEADRFDLLPAPVFAKGFLREYALYIGLSPDDVVNHYLSVSRPAEAPGESGEEVPRVRPKPKTVDPGPTPVRRNWSYGLVLAVAGLVLLVLVAVAAWFADRRRDADPAGGNGQALPPIAAPLPAAAPAVPAATQPPPQPAAPLEVSLAFSKDCWVEAVIDGKNRFSELRVQGEALPLQAEKSIVLTLGNAGAVEIQVNGYPLDLQSKDGDVVRDLQIDLKTVETLKAKKEAL